jgi:hypothetical protein
MTNTTIREVDIASNATVGDKMCPVRSVRPMLLSNATVDGAKVAGERDGRRREYAIRRKAERGARTGSR